MDNISKLAERCEKAAFPARNMREAYDLVEIRTAISRLVDHRVPDAYSPDWLGSIDASVTLVSDGDHPSVIVRQAIDNCIVAIASNDEVEFVRRLPAFICAEALRARSAAAQK